MDWSSRWRSDRREQGMNVLLCCLRWPFRIPAAWDALTLVILEWSCLSYAHLPVLVGTVSCKSRDTPGQSGQYQPHFGLRDDWCSNYPLVGLWNPFCISTVVIRQFCFFSNSRLYSVLTSGCARRNTVSKIYIHTHRYQRSRSDKISIVGLEYFKCHPTGALWDIWAGNDFHIKLHSARGKMSIPYGVGTHNLVETFKNPLSGDNWNRTYGNSLIPIFPEGQCSSALNIVHAQAVSHGIYVSIVL
jgi:hypothetical protein